MKIRPSVGSTVFGVRDVEMSNGGFVTGYQDDGKVLVRFGDGISRALPIASVVSAADRKAEPRFASKDWEEAATLGDYISRLESRHSKEQQNK